MNGLSPYLADSLSPTTRAASGGEGGSPPIQPTLELTAVDQTTMNFVLTTDETETGVTVTCAIGSDPGPSGEYPITVSMTPGGGGQWTGSIGSGDGLDPEETVYGKAVATNGDGDSDPAFDNAQTPGYPPNPPSISSISWNNDTDNPAVSLSFSHSGGATTWKLYRSTDGGFNYSEYQSGETVTTGLNDTGVGLGNSYYYKLTNSNAQGESDYSAPASISLV